MISRPNSISTSLKDIYDLSVAAYNLMEEDRYTFGGWIKREKKAGLLVNHQDTDAVTEESKATPIEMSLSTFIKKKYADMTSDGKLKSLLEILNICAQVEDMEITPVQSFKLLAAAKANLQSGKLSNLLDVSLHQEFYTKYDEITVKAEKFIDERSELHCKNTKKLDSEKERLIETETLYNSMEFELQHSITSRADEVLQLKAELAELNTIYEKSVLAHTQAVRETESLKVAIKTFEKSQEDDPFLAQKWVTMENAFCVLQKEHKLLNEEARTSKDKIRVLETSLTKTREDLRSAKDRLKKMESTTLVNDSLCKSQRDTIEKLSNTLQEMSKDRMEVKAHEPASIQTNTKAYSSNQKRYTPKLWPGIGSVVNSVKVATNNNTIASSSVLPKIQHPGGRN